MGKGADIVVHRAREAAEHLPGSAAALQAKAGVAGQVAKDKAEKGLASLAGLGSKIVLGTHDLFEQIRWVGAPGLGRWAARGLTGGGSGGRWRGGAPRCAALQLQLRSPLPLLPCVHPCRLCCSHAVQNELALTEQDVNAAMRSQSSKSLAGQARYSRCGSNSSCWR